MGVKLALNKDDDKRITTDGVLSLARGHFQLYYISKWIYIYIIITIFPFGQTFLCNLSFIFLSFSDLRKDSLEHSKHKFTPYIGAELGDVKGYM